MRYECVSSLVFCTASNIYLDQSPPSCSTDYSRFPIEVCPNGEYATAVLSLTFIFSFSVAIHPFKCDISGIFFSLIVLKYC